MSKELYMRAHEELVDEYLETHPNATWDEAYQASADAAMGRMSENLWSHADYLRKSRLEGA